MTKPLWNSQEIAKATQGRVNGGFEVNGISIDTRTLKKGDLFIALKGPNFDGHDFVAQAFQKGAAGLLGERDLPGKPSIVVQDSMAALLDLAKASRARCHGKILAVTGSVGKTSTKEMLIHSLSCFGSVHASIGNLNNHWGVPLSLARMPESSNFGVYELGMNHAGEIEPLSLLVKPEMAIITWVAAAHLEFFSSVADIAKAKAEIFAGLQPGGTALLPMDNEHIDLLKSIAKARAVEKIMTFGAGSAADIRLLEYSALAEGGLVAAQYKGKQVGYRIGASGRHLAMNSLAVLGAILNLGLDVDKALAALSQFQALAGRGKKQIIDLPKGSKIELIDEAYNASPASMQAALQTSAEDKPAGRLIAVLGDMRELGPTSEELHRSLSAHLKGFHKVYLCGPYMKSLWEELPEGIRGYYAEQSTDLIAPLMDDIKAGDRILIKGSLGTKMAPIVEAILAIKKGAIKRGAENHVI